MSALPTLWDVIERPRLPLSEAARFVRQFEWAYRKWHAYPLAWLGVASPILDEMGWLHFSGYSRVCPLLFIHRLESRDARAGIGRTTSGLLTALERHWHKCHEDEVPERARNRRKAVRA